MTRILSAALSAVVLAAESAPDPARAALDETFAAASASWAAKDFAAVRAGCGKVLAQAGAPPHFRSYAQLRIAQSYAAEGNTAAAKAEYEKIVANADYPEVHRHEAGECLEELERTAKGLPARDVKASRTKVPVVDRFAAEFFVATTGYDANPGTREKPFASLERARDAIRALKSKGELAGPAGVRVLPGEYPVKETFELTRADSGTEMAPIVYRADQKGTAVLYGGKRLSGFTPSADARLPEEARGKVFQCDLRKQGVNDLAPLQERGYGKPPPPAALELFFNGEPMTLARWPNSGFVNGGAIIEPGSIQDGKPSVFEYLDDRHARWTNAADGWLYGYFAHGWADRTLKITHIDPATKRVACGPYHLLARSMEPVKWFNKGRIKYHAFNLLEELDQPGEWHLDRATAILHFYPPSDPAGATVEIGMLTAPMLSMANVSHVRIEGLVFDLSRSSGMLIRDSEHCLIAGCTLKRFAGMGVKMTGGRENGIFGCDLYSLGQRATEVSGGDRKTLTPVNHFVENCWMHSFGGIQINSGRDHIIDNNLFAECEKGISGRYNANNKQWERLGKDPAFILSERYLQRYPDLRRLGTEPGLSSAWRNVFWKCGPMFNTYGRPSEDGFDRLANVEYASEDPGFVDAGRGDFRLRPGAELFGRVGFRPIPVEEVGLYEDEHRANWPVNPSAIAAQKSTSTK